MKRLMVAAVGAYLIAALASRTAERAGVTHCGCSRACWCQRPGLSLFRWVFPRGHRGKYTPEDKADLEAASR